MTDRPPLPHDEKEVKARLQAQLPNVLSALGYHERPRGGTITPLNPWRNDRRPGSFVIWLNGDAGGAWKDFATAEQGDLYQLIEKSLGLRAWIDAYWWALDFLGLGRGEVRTADQVARDRARAEADRKAAEARQASEDAAKGRAAKALWLSGDPNVIGTAAWAYLTGPRQLALSRLPHVPHAMRAFGSLEHFDRKTGEVTDWPAMAWAVNSPLVPGRPGAVTGVHLTWLRPDGSDKAPVEKAKKMRGLVAGGSIRVWQGATRLSPEKAVAAGRTGPLVVTEGIEDALSAAVVKPSNRVWAAGSLSLMHELVKLAGWPACASAVVLVRDNDWDKPQAVEAFEACEADWRRAAAGRPLKVIAATRGKDLNDMLRGIG